MSDWQLLDDGSFNGVKKYIRAGAEDDSVDIRYEGWGGTRIADQNKAMDAPNMRSDMPLVGRIPAEVGLKWLVEEGLDMWNPDHQDGVIRKLMDSDYRYLVPGMARIIM